MRVYTYMVGFNLSYRSAVLANKVQLSISPEEKNPKASKSVGYCLQSSKM